MYQLYRNILFLRFIIGSFWTDVHCLRDGSFLCEISEGKAPSLPRQAREQVPSLSRYSSKFQAAKKKLKQAWFLFPPVTFSHYSRNKECALAHSRACGGRLRHLPYTPQCASSRSVFFFTGKQFPVKKEILAYFSICDRIRTPVIYGQALYIRRN